MAMAAAPYDDAGMLTVGSAVLDNMLETATVCGDIAPGGSASDACRESILYLLNHLP